MIVDNVDIFHIDKDILNFLNYNPYLSNNDILIGFSFKYFNKLCLENIYLNDIEYNYGNGGIFPTINHNDISWLIEKSHGKLYNLNNQQIKIINLLYEGSTICSLREYKRNEEQYKYITRKKKLEKILTN